MSTCRPAIEAGNWPAAVGHKNVGLPLVYGKAEGCLATPVVTFVRTSATKGAFDESLKKALKAGLGLESCAS